MKEFSSNLNLQELWEGLPEQISIWFNIVTSKLSVIVDFLYQKALANPLPMGVILLALVGIPLIFFKINKTKSETESDGRLDQLMEEMQNFEIKTPLIDLQKNFSESPITNKEPTHEESSFNYELEITPILPDSDQIHETLEPDTLIELPSLISDEENRESDILSHPEESETADAPLPANAIDYQFQLNDDDSEQESATRQTSVDWSQISRPALSDYDDNTLTVEGIEHLQQELDESSQEMTLDLPPEQEQEEELIREIEMTSAIPAPEPVETPSQHEDIENNPSTIEEEIQYPEEEDAPSPSANPVATESDADLELSATEDDHLTTHQEAVEESLDSPVQSTVAVPEKIMQESRLLQSLPLKPILKSQPIPSHTRLQSPGKDYKKLLESFILLKDQKR